MAAETMYDEPIRQTEERLANVRDDLANARATREDAIRRGATRPVYDEYDDGKSYEMWAELADDSHELEKKLTEQHHGLLTSLDGLRKHRAELLECTAAQQTANCDQADGYAPSVSVEAVSGGGLRIRLN